MIPRIIPDERHNFCVACAHGLLHINKNNKRFNYFPFAAESTESDNSSPWGISSSCDDSFLDPPCEIARELWFRFQIPPPELESGGYHRNSLCGVHSDSSCFGLCKVLLPNSARAPKAWKLQLHWSEVKIFRVREKCNQRPPFLQVLLVARIKTGPRVLNLPIEVPGYWTPPSVA